MQQVKIFVPSYTTIEEQINTWLQENPTFKIVGLFTCPMHDLYNYGTPTVCNQWAETTVVYTEE